MKPLILHRPAVETLERRIVPAFPAVFDLSSLTGANGFKLTEETYYDHVGSSLSDAGDVNGDGLGDILIGASNAHGAGYYSGVSYLVFGRTEGFAANIDLGELDGTDGFRLEGDLTLGHAGESVSGAGDINGDGYDDLIISGWNQISYVVFGKAAGFAASILLSSLNGADGFTLTDSTSSIHGARQAAAAGDVNGDGFDDFVLAGDYYSTAVSYVVFGKGGPFGASLDLATLDGTNGFRVEPHSIGGLFGHTVSGAGDVNGDGFADLIIGAPNSYLANSTGVSHVILGKAGGFGASLDVASLDGANGFRIVGAAYNDGFGFSVSSAGDMNGDGFDDLVIGAGAFGYYGSVDRGACYVVFGKPVFAAQFGVSTLDGKNGFKISGAAKGDLLGYAVSDIGDINGDDYDDVILSAPGADPAGPNGGVSYVVLGKAGNFSANLKVGSLSGHKGFRIEGPDSLTGVSGAGDINGDGFDDLIIGTPGAEYAFGGAYVVFGGNPPTISADGRTATFLDVDGDRVTITADRGAFAISDFTLEQGDQNYVEGGALFSRLSIRAELAGARIRITATPGPLGGDGLVNLGYLDATGVDLGKVRITGDLGRISAGDGDGIGPALGVLNVHSLGALGLATQTGPDASLTSHLDGQVGTVIVKTNVLGAEFFTTRNLFAFRVGGSVADSTIGAGYGPDGTAINGDARIATASILGDWVRSNLAAGVNAGADGQFGTDDDTALGGGSANIVSRLANIIIGGQVLGDTDDATHYGFVAQFVGRFVRHGALLPLTPGADNLLLGPTFDVHVREVAATI